MKKLSKQKASRELDKILESVARPKIVKAQKMSKLKSRLNEKMKKDSQNFPGKAVTDKVLKTGGAQNKAAMDAVATKLKDYLNIKNNSNPEFPNQNNSKTDYKSPMYRNNTEQEDYIDDWRGGGLEDLEYGTEPSAEFSERFKKNLDGSQETGNAQSNKEGDLGNVVSNKVGERIQKTMKKKYKILKGPEGFAVPIDWTQHPNPGYRPSLAEAYEEDMDEDKKAKPDFLDLDKDGDTKEPMKKAAKEVSEETDVCESCGEVHEGDCGGGDDSMNLNEVQGINAERIAKEIHDAMDGVGTDESAFFTAIQPVGRKGLTPEEQKQVKEAYKNLYDEGLCERIPGDFGGSELEKALKALGCSMVNENTSLNESVGRDMSFMKHLMGYGKKTQ